MTMLDQQKQEEDRQAPLNSGKLNSTMMTMRVMMDILRLPAPRIYTK